MQFEPERSRESIHPAGADYALIFLFTVCLYALLMQRYPIIYGGDTIARLINFPKILNGHQLPLLQVLIYFALRWSYSAKSIFLLMAIISAIGCSGLYALVREITLDRRAARLAALFYATHPFILYYSRVPYQEPLLMAGIAWGFYFLFRPASLSNRLLSGLCLGLACLSRYEGWIATLIAAIFDIRRNRQKGSGFFPSIVQSVVMFWWAPAAWIAWNRDLSPAGTYVLDLALQPGRFYRPYFISKSALWWTESAVVLLALLGFTYSWADARMRKDLRFRVLEAFLLLYMSVLIFSGHGIPPDPTRLLTEREAFVPIGILVLYAGIGTSLFIKRIEDLRIGWSIPGYAVPMLMLILITGYSLNKGLHHIASANADPDLKTDFEVARFLAQKQAGSVILAAPLPKEPMESYVQSVEQWSGLAGRARAEELLKESETTPLDYQRVRVFSWMSKDQLQPGDRLQNLDDAGIERFLREKGIVFLVVFSDFTPVAQHEKTMLACCAERHSPELEIRNGGKAARIYPVCSRFSLCR